MTDDIEQNIDTTLIKEKINFFSFINTFRELIWIHLSFYSQVAFNISVEHLELLFTKD